MSRYEVVGNGCWAWTGTLTWGGYGQISRHGRNVLAHRAMYEHLVGPVPQGWELDHECHDSAACVGRCPHRSCVNPMHLRPLERSEHRRATAEQLARRK